MKKFLSYFLISLILLLNIGVPVSVLAAVPTIKFGVVEDTSQSSGDKRAWYFKINTTNIADGSSVSCEIKEGTTVLKDYISTKITNGVGSCFTGYILKPATVYKVTAMTPDVSASFEQKTGGVEQTTTVQQKTNPTDTYWFRDMDNAFRGINGPLNLPGFTTIEACESAKKTYWVGLNNKTSTLPCELITQEQVLVNFEAEKKINAQIPTNDVTPVTPQLNTTGNKTIYTLLAPFGGLTKMSSKSNDPTCAADPGCITNNIGKYLNIIFKLGIGLCAALAVIMLIINGMTYMGDESIFKKTEAKSKMYSAILGLLIALGAWALLNTINPDLTGAGGFKILTAGIEIKDFGVSGGATFDGKPININFNKEAYPAAKIASEKTGVETAFILAMFAQETGNGANTGGCNYTNANMGDGQLQALKTVAANLNIDYTKINMSCSGAVANDHGGAIGLTQFIPTTWLQYSGRAKQLLGHEPNPWNVSDALMMTAIFLQDKGGAGSNTANQETAACKYFGSCAQTVSCGSGITGTYGQCILGKKVSIQQQIDASIKKGEIN